MKTSAEHLTIADTLRKKARRHLRRTGSDHAYKIRRQHRGEDLVAALGAVGRVARNGMPTDYDPIWDAERLYNSPHLSGNLAGTTNTDIYVPGNYQGQPTRPSPTAGVVLINYA